MKSYILLAFLVLVTSQVFAKKSYEGYKFYEAKFENDEQAKLLKSMEEVHLVDLWRMLTNGKADFMVSPDKDYVVEVMKNQGIELRLGAENVQEFIDMETKMNEMGRADQDWWKSYHEIDDINAQVKAIVDASADAELEYIGDSYEGIQMNIVKVCRGGCDNKPAMLIQGGIHAREWIGPATVSWMLNELLNNAENDNLIEQLDWYFVVNVNPDGYKYTWTDDRMWRKTRSAHDTICLGTDANRNYDYCWNTGGSSNSECSDTYHGPTALSEPEITHILDFAGKHVTAGNTGIKYFVDIHSYSEYVLLPYGVSAPPTDCNKNAPDATEREQKANKWNDALTAASDLNLKYTVGNVVDLLYEASGGSFDHMLGNLGIKYSIGMELRPSSNNVLIGFQLPPEQIIPCATEVWAFHKAAANDMIDEYASSP